MAMSIDLICVIQLPITEQLYVIRMNRFGLVKIRKPLPAADLIAMKCARITFNCLTQRTHLGLLWRAALACAFTPQTAPQRAQLAIS